MQSSPLPAIDDGRSRVGAAAQRRPTERGDKAELDLSHLLDARRKGKKKALPEGQAELGLKKWESLGGGLYRWVKTGSLYERPVINGRPTFRALGTTHEKSGRQALAKRQIALAQFKAGAGASPYAAQSLVLTGEVIKRYAADGCPDRHRSQRPLATRRGELRNCATLLRFFETMPIEEVTLAAMDRYCDRRLGEVKRGAGYRTVDMELGTLQNAFTWAVRCELVRFNPMAGRRVKYSSEKNIHHCREFMPSDAEQLHEVARWLFTSNGILGEAAGWQYLLEAFTGLRTSEALALRVDAVAGAPGHICSDKATGAWKHLQVGRCKNGINPFVIITREIEELLRALLKWKSARWPSSEWFLPSPRRFGAKHLDKSHLAHRLVRASAHFGRKLTGHGARAYYVTARRSWGVSDTQIAVEIGHRGGPGLLTTTYGGVPTNWLTGDGPRMTWLPGTGEPAWGALDLREAGNILQMPKTRAA